MKLEGIVKRVNLARRSKRADIFPYLGFRTKLDSAIDLVEWVEENCDERNIKQEARKHLITTATSCMEVYFKQVAQVFIDAGSIHSNFDEILRQYNITLSDLVEIKNEHFSVGEIITACYSLQDLESINRFFTKMFGIKRFLSEVEQTLVEPEEGLPYILIEKIPDIWSRIDELVTLRHMIIHHEGFKRVLGYNRLSKLSICVIGFISAADTYIMSMIPDEVAS